MRDTMAVLGTQRSGDGTQWHLQAPEEAMRNPWKRVLGLCTIGIGFGLSAPAQAASAVGPYYATPSWDQTLPATTRFIVLTNMGGAAVLDRETGLVWEQSPEPSILDWNGASRHCVNLNTGARSGWRMPTLQELMSLLDRSVSPGPALPSGHPFSNVQRSAYWSATARDNSPGLAWVVDLETGGADAISKALQTFVWCVRGRQGVDAQ
jgi:hypothetical protein